MQYSWRGTSIKYLFLFLSLFIHFATCQVHAAMPVPAGREFFQYAPVASPVSGDDANTAKPIGLGPWAEGGELVSVKIALGEFTDAVDVYVGMTTSLSGSSLWLFQYDGSFLQYTDRLVPWLSLVPMFRPRDSLLLEIPAKALPAGTYTFYLLASPKGNLSSYYLWETQLVVPQCGDCFEGNLLVYAFCGGNMFPGDSCADASCVPPGLASAIFAEWKKQFKAKYNLSEEEFTNRIKVSSVTWQEGPLYVWLQISYVFAMDWVRSRQNQSIGLGSYPLTAEPDANAISEIVKSELRRNDRFDMKGVVDFAAAETSLRTCGEGMTADWCGARFENVTGRLLVWGRREIDLDANKCQIAAVDLSTGELAYCNETPCWIYDRRSEK